MESIGHILFASDLSEPSRAALRRAGELKRQLGARLTVLHVVEAGLSRQLAERRCREAMEILEQHMADVVDAEARHVAVEVLRGERFATILEQAEARGADLIVLGDTKKRRWKELFGGTTLERVPRLSAQPVLVAGHGGNEPYRRLLAAFDASPAAGKALRLALTIASEAECRIVHAAETPVLAQFMTRQAGDALAANAIKGVRSSLLHELERAGPLRRRPDLQIVEGNAHFVIPDQMRDFTPDLLALGTHARGSTATALLGSFARDLLTAASCDVLVAAPDRVLADTT